MSSITLRTKIPGPKSIELSRQRDQNIPKAVFQVSPIFVAQASGSVIEDVDGNCFLDLAGGLGALNVGHTPVPVVSAVKNQSEKFLHTCFHVAMHQPYVDLATKLNAITPGSHAKKTILLNSGAEAVENAVKIARYYTKRPAIITFEHGYHGRTLLTMSLTSKVKPYKFGFGPFAPEIYRLPFPYLYRRPAQLTEEQYIVSALNHFRDFLKTQVAPESVAAIIFEPVTGEGGFIEMPPAYLKGLIQICREHGILIIADEVQTGFCRTGAMFASNLYDLVPDIITTAKSLSAGLPLAGVTARAEIMDAIHVGGLGGTFGGNPVSCVAALAAIEIMESQNLSEKARTLGTRFRNGLKTIQNKCANIGDIRGPGAMVGIEMVKDGETKEPATELTGNIIKRCIESGLLILSAGVHSNVIRTLMPLIMTSEQVDEGLEVLERVMLDVR